MIWAFSGHPCFLSALNYLTDFTEESRNFNESVLNQIILFFIVASSLGFWLGKFHQRMQDSVSSWLFQLKYIAHLMYVTLLMKKSTTVPSQSAISLMLLHSIEWDTHSHTNREKSLFWNTALESSYTFFPTCYVENFVMGKNITQFIDPIIYS